jgi:polysaccharide pyruvyl transferase WcaK-like protein
MPVNGGDEALLMALLRGLTGLWPTAPITVLCHRPDESRRLLPAVHIEPAIARDNDVSRVEPFYREADLVISTPGGFLHEHYNIEPALRGFELATRLGKPLALFAQSIGPFTTPDAIASLVSALAGARLIAVRDSASFNSLAAYGITGNRVVRVPDAAFLWHHLAPELYVRKVGPPRRAALCFRRWPHNDRDGVKETIKKGRRLVEHLASRGLEDFLFVSTCQGVPGYVDDSELACRIVEGLDDRLRSRCVVDRERYHPEDLIRLLSSCDVMFSMRLHGCLLAILGGTPAMGLGYEPKTAEIFRLMGLKKYQVPFTAYQTRWCQCASALLDDLDAVRLEIPATLNRMAGEVSRVLRRLTSLLNSSSSLASSR